jgi:predicted RNA-binding Zn-ribbon protein involved in translation (DUF1610 family)
MEGEESSFSLDLILRASYNNIINIRLSKEVIFMRRKIIKPEGLELMRYRNDGYAICNHCGALMDFKDNPRTGGTIYVCPSCKWEVDSMDYEYEADEEDEWTSDAQGYFNGDIPPAGCRACGGPYPDCMTSCNLFDD